MSKYLLVALFALTTATVSARFYVLEAHLEQPKIVQKQHNQSLPDTPSEEECELTLDADEQPNTNTSPKLCKTEQPRQYTEIDVRELIQKFGPYEK